MQRPPSISYKCSRSGVLCRQGHAACVRARTHDGTGALKWLSMWDENQYRCVDSPRPSHTAPSLGIKHAVSLSLATASSLNPDGAIRARCSADVCSAHEYLGWGNFGFSSNFTAIHEAAALGLRTLLKVSFMFWERTNGPHSMLRLRDDYMCVPIHCTHAPPALDSL